MTETVEGLILRLDAQLDRYNAEVAGAANATERSMQRIQTSASSVEKSYGTLANNSRISGQIMQHIARSTADSFAAGTPPMMIFTTHLGQLAEAGAYAGGSLGKVGAFLGGPWGIAATFAVTALVPLIGKLFEAGDGVDDLVRKLRDHVRQAEASDRANRLFAQSLEGVEQAARDQEKALEALENRNKTQEEQTAKSIKDTLDRAKAIRIETQALLDAAKAWNERYKGSLASTDPRFAREFEVPQSRIDELQKTLEKSKADAEAAEARLTRALSLETVQQASRDPAKVINDRYDAQVEGARRAAVASGKVTTALDLEVKAINRAREAELKRLNTAGSRTSNAFVGGELSFAQARAIAERAGLKVNSDYRSPARQAQLYNDPSVNRPGNPVARPGASAHNGVDGRWALDIQLAPGVTPELLRKVFAAQGVTLTKILPEKGHLHIEGKRTEADVAADKAAAAEQKQAEQLDRQYATTARRIALEQELAALRASGNSFEAQIADWLESDAKIESENVDLARSAKEEDQKRLQALKDMARAAIDLNHAQKDSLIGGISTDKLRDEVEKSAQASLDAQERAADQLHQRQEDQVRTLAGLYEDAFRGGTHAIWSDFKHIGMQVIAEVLARFTLSSLGGGGGGFNFGSALTSAIGHVLPGFGSPHNLLPPGYASGGSMVIGGRGGTDQNMLSLNGSPIARVSSGEVLNIANPRLSPQGQQGGGVSVVRLELSGDIDARIQNVSGPVAIEVVRAAQPALTEHAVGETMRRAGRPRM